MHGAALAIWSAIRGLVRCIYDSYRLGGRTLRVAPAIVAIAVIPEFAQHAAEIGIGMFDSRDAARALADDPLRWGFGYVKLTGFVLAILLTARFWALDGSLRRAFLVPPRTLLRTAAAIAATMLTGAALDHLAGMLPPLPGGALSIVAAILQAGLAAWAIAELTEDRSTSLARLLTTQLPTAFLLLVLFAAAMAPGQLLHKANHLLALGQPDVLVWSLMAFDSLVVGLIAAIVGAALHVTLRAAPSWHGWGRAPGRSQQRASQPGDAADHFDIA
ncbi:hypothetical protein [Sphingomonas sp. LM7]|uniref:hypothetical protein n=1 Tax=Sphingomonas sp. LM7 TaxID=1938607 RepID=UPI00098395C4|nr:hypothetical protein [Sphingomonas sp. LM7]AQR73724.1 hypothetical protein BXU08_08775 [Sphingomonas sp. LM7]